MLVKQQTTQKWANKWTNLNKGRHTYSFIKDVRKRLAQSWIMPDHYTTQLSTGHGNFNAKLNTFRLTEITCNCGQEDTATHVLYSYTNTETSRKILEEKIKVEDTLRLCNPQKLIEQHTDKHFNRFSIYVCNEKTGRKNRSLKKEREKETHKILPRPRRHNNLTEVMCQGRK